MKLLGSTESKITKDKNGKNVPHLEITEVMIISKIQECYIHLFQTIHLVVYYKSPQNILKTFNSEFQEIKIWFTDQNSKLLEVEDEIDLTLITK